MLLFKRKRLKVGLILDLHLGNNPFDPKQVSAEDIRIAYSNSLLGQLDHLESKGCDLVVFGGDTFDTPHPDNEDIAMLINAMAGYRHFKYYFILGNHEIESNNIHALKTLEAVAAISKVSITVITKASSREINGFPVSFLSYPFTEPNFPDEPGLVFLHNEFRGAKRDNGSVFEKGTEFRFDYAEEANQFYVSGHLHTYQCSGKELAGHVEAGHRRYSSGRIYFGRLGGMRHDGGEFNTAGIVTMTKEKGRYVYDVETYNPKPFWIIRSVRYASDDAFYDHMEEIRETGVHDHLISVRVKADSPYIPSEDNLKLYKFLSIETKRTAYEELHEEMHEERQTKDLSGFMGDWLDRVSSMKLKGFSLDRFNRLRQKIGS